MTDKNEKELKKLKDQKEIRWFLIEHKKCGAVFTIDSKQFVKTYENQKEFICPNCHVAVIKNNISYQDSYPLEKISDLYAFTGFLTIYNHLIGNLEGSTIREIHPKDLEAIKNLHKIPDRP